MSNEKNSKNEKLKQLAKQDNNTKPYGGFSSLVFFMIIGSAAFYEPFKEAKLPVLAVILSFLISLFMICIFCRIVSIKNKAVIGLILSLTALATVPMQFFRLRDYFSFIGKTADLYRSTVFVLFASVIIYALCMFCLVKCKATVFRASLLALPLPLFLLLFMLPAPFMHGIQSPYRTVEFTNAVFIADVKTSVIASFLITADTLSLYFISDKIAYKEREKEKEKGKLIYGKCGVMSAYAFIFVMMLVIKLFFGSDEIPVGNAAFSLLEEAYPEKCGALFIIFFTVSLIFRFSSYLLLIGKTADFVKSAFERPKAT